MEIKLITYAYEATIIDLPISMYMLVNVKSYEKLFTFVLIQRQHSII